MRVGVVRWSVAERGGGTRMKPKPITFHFPGWGAGDGTAHKAISQSLRPVVLWVLPKDHGGQMGTTGGVSF